jgi:hypothetical protein
MKAWSSPECEEVSRETDGPGNPTPFIRPGPAGRNRPGSIGYLVRNPWLATIAFTSDRRVQWSFFISATAFLTAG